MPARVWTGHTALVCTYVGRRLKRYCCGHTGIVTKGLMKNLEAIRRKNSIDSLQKTVILGTSHIIRKVLQSET
jgi:hypothetical protein